MQGFFIPASDVVSGTWLIKRIESFQQRKIKNPQGLRAAGPMDGALYF